MGNEIMSLPSFTNPDALFLLLLLPLFAYIGRPRLRYRRQRDLTSMAIRLLLVTLLILSLAGIQIRKRADKLAVVFLVDVSDSMDQIAKRDALNYVKDSIEGMTDKDQAAVILFGADALVEEPMTDLVDLSQVTVSPISLNTDLAEAIQLGLALFPPDTAKRMVILSDGIETSGDADRAARLAAATGVQIDYVPFSRKAQPEVLVSNVSVPSVVSQDEPFDVVVTIDSQTETAAKLLIQSGGIVLYEEVVNLRAGTNRFAKGPIKAPRVGFVDFQVSIEPVSVDGFHRNNELAAFSRVTGRPRILLVASDPAELTYLEPALLDAGLLIDKVAPVDMPSALAPLSAYSSIVLANVPASELTKSQMELIEIYVRDLGGGLVTIGGPDSYGVGGYFETPLERTLPVEMRIKDKERVPQLTIVFVIDRSGSMEMVGTSGYSNLELAKEAILRSFNFLNDYDRAGVISFDTEAFWVVDIQDIGSAENRAHLQEVISTLRSGGGTDIFGGLSAADKQLPQDPSQLKHIVLLTDGGANPAGILPLVDRMYTNYDITTSVIAVGDGYAPWLADLPPRGGGNFHVTTNTENIPTILASETVLATRSYIFEEPFVPVLTAQSPIMDGITASPELNGYVATTPKDTSTVILTGPEDDPLLASWQYGLGRSVAFTSDATARWANNWVTWENYQRFWNQAIRWTITEGKDTNLEAWVEERGEQAVLVVDARDNSGDYLNALDLDASVVYPDRQTESLGMQQVAPGRYEAVFTPENEGAYFIRVAGATREDAEIEASVAQTTGWVLSYSNEYRPRPTDKQFLDRISGITGGGSLAENPLVAFEHNLDQQQAATPIHPYLLALAAFLLVADIAVRRIVINKSDVDKFRKRFSHESPFAEATVPATVTMSGLKEAKKRAALPTDELKPGELAQVQSKASQVEKQPKAKATPPPQPDTTIAAQLLKKRKDNQE
jgi:Mg-chelatase subunit ChlD